MREGEAWTSGQATVPPVFPVAGLAEHTISLGVEIDWSSNEGFDDVVDYVKWGFTFHPDEENNTRQLDVCDTLKKIKVVNELDRGLLDTIQRRCSMKNKLRPLDVIMAHPDTDFFTAGTYLVGSLCCNRFQLC
ncbi:hypothetical protein SPFM12_00301 [Salmonella phage SPFM12]|nr:hypothetical protein SPFM12_00301 [Salmonella phage SPFM12]